MKSIGSQTEVTKSLRQLKASEQEHLHEIGSLQEKIETLRDQLKNLSNSASKIIEKKLTTPKNTKNRPVFNPTYSSKKLQSFQDERQKIFRQIDETKALIQSLKLQQEPEIKSDIIKKQTQIKQLAFQLEKCIEQKNYVIDELQTNKAKLNGFKQSVQTKQFAENQRLLDDCKKQKAKYEKKLNSAISQQILASLFLFQINSKIETYTQARNEQQDKAVSPREINRLLTQINKVITSRNEIEKEKNKEISQLKGQIKELQDKNTHLNNYYRQIEYMIMERGLEERFYKSKIERVSKSTDFLNSNRQASSVQTKKRYLKSDTLNKHPSEAKTKLVSQTSPLPRINQNLIKIGSTELTPESKIIKDSHSASEDIEKVHSISFILSDNKIVGIKTTYIAKEGKKIIGQTLSIDGLDTIERTVQKQILVKEIKDIQYPINSKHLCLKIYRFNSSVQIIGTEYYGATQKFNISLKNIKNLQFVVQKNKQGNFQKPKGIIINLESKVAIDKFAKTQDTQKSLAESQGVFLTSSPANLKQRAQSIDSVSVSSKKNVVKLSKKETEASLDHRLLIRKKLV